MIKKIIVGLMLVGSVAFGCGDDSDHHTLSQEVKKGNIWVENGMIKYSKKYLSITQALVNNGDLNMDDIKVLEAKTLVYAQNHLGVAK